MKIRFEISGFASALALIALGSWLAGYFSIDLVPGQPLLESLRLHIAALMLVLAVVLFLARARWRGLVLAIIAVVALAQDVVLINDLFSRRPDTSALADAPKLKLLHFNVLRGNDNGAAIADYIEASGADIVTVLEALPLQPHFARLAATYPYRMGCDSAAACDTVLMSKLPFENGRVRELSYFSPGRLILTEFDFAGKRIGFVAVHLTKPYFDGVADGEIWMLRRRLDTLPQPLIVAGDFNAAVWSKNLKGLIDGNDLLIGPDLPGTWPPRFGRFGVPIDNVFSRAPLVITKLEALPSSMGSNHLGLTAEIALLPE